MGHEIDLNKYNIRTDLILESITDNDNTKYDVLNLGNDSFDVEVVISYYSVGDNTPSNLLTISSKIEKIDGKYVVTKYSDNV